LAREKVVSDGGKQMWNGAEASWKKLGREHTTLFEPRLFLGAAFF
jgi:hypothetical protein